MDSNAKVQMRILIDNSHGGGLSGSVTDFANQLGSDFS